MSLVGGVLGVLFTIPCRALIVHARLRFPEGVATAEVLKAGTTADSAAGAVRLLLRSRSLGGGFKICRRGFQAGGANRWKEQLQLGRSTFGGLNLSPALVAVGLHHWPEHGHWVFRWGYGMAR